VFEAVRAKLTGSRATADTTSMDGGFGSRARRVAAWVAAAMAVSAALAGPLPAAAGDAVVHNPRGRVLGVADAQPNAATQFRRSAAPLHRFAPLTTASLLTYHNGPVVHDGHVYAIFWEPPGYAYPSDYKPAVAKYFADVAADSGKRTNVYSTTRQYRDALGPAPYKVAFNGSYTDTSPLPASNCTDTMAPACLSDGALTAELGAFVSAHALPRGMTNQYFLFTPPGVGSCYPSSAGDQCAYEVFCAYHSWFSSSGTVLYAVHPYVTGIQSCDVGQSPTGTSADAVLNVVSHEHNEIVTDPTGGGWFDANGEENGDKCAWQWGSLHGSANAAFNQVIAGSPYLLQLEWSNRDGGCAATTANQSPTPSFQRVGPAVARKPVHFTAAAARDPDGTIASYAWRFGDGGTGSGVAPAHTYKNGGTFQVQLRVTDDEGGSATRTLGVVVARGATAPRKKPGKTKKKKRKHPHRSGGHAA
jgi:hypothetical protein